MRNGICNPRIAAMIYDAAILDVDGVLTRTATQHERAWSVVLDRALAARGDARPFSHEEYLAHVDGKPRMAGLRAFLRSRGVDLEEGEAEALAAAKDHAYLRLLDEEGVEVYDDAARQVRAWRAQGLGIAFVSSSRNAARVLHAAGLSECFDVLVDGAWAREHGLSGKPDLFREAVKQLGVEATTSFVVEDAVAGVAAAAAVGFGLVIGLARGGRAQDLLEHGAHRVVERLDELAGLSEAGTHRAAALEGALPLDRFTGRLGGRRPLLLIDFDGTLTPIVPHPDRATLDDDTRALLGRVARRVRLAIVSGRDRADLEARVGLAGLWYAGSHGFDIAAPDGRVFGPMDSADGRRAIEELAQAEQRLRREIAAWPGVVVERKRFGLTAHYRMADEATSERVARVVRALAAELRALAAHPGERTMELRPAVEWDKGHAVRRILEEWSFDARAEIPIYLGDGRTDEDAFRAIRCFGLGVFVGDARRPTHATLRLDHPTQVRAWLRELEAWLSGRAAKSSWRLRFEGYDPRREGLREALSTLGNGYVATRGAAEESSADAVHYPGTYMAGGYDRITTEVRGHLVENEDLVNLPNWLPLTFQVEGSEWFSLDRSVVLDLTQELDMERGELTRTIRFEDAEGRRSQLVSRRLVSMADPHAAAMKWQLVPLDWSGTILIRSSLDGSVRNAGVERYGALRSQHLVTDGIGHDGATIWLAVRTRQSWLRVAQAARTEVRVRGRPVGEARVDEHEDRVDLTVRLEASRGVPIDVEKIVATHASRDHAISEPLSGALGRLAHLPAYDDLLAAHERSWASLWRRCDIRLGGGREEESRILRLHIFHLLQVASPHVADRDVGIPARGLHGEAYRGHVFWDELFVFPFLNYSIPELTRELLMYRYRRLGAARRLARDLGHAGAAFPWQSGASGREESQTLHLNPLSGRWVPDETHLQRHVNAAIAWNVWRYHAVTGDHEFLAFYGAEMLVEIARFWASVATWDEDLRRYRIRGVVGPDEFHTRYPGADRAGIDDNAYTNVMAAWCLRCAERALAEIGDERRQELLDALGVTEEDCARWRDVASKLRVVFQDGGIISQFDGYADLVELDWDAYRARYGDIHRLDRILEAEGRTPNAFKVSKQADVLMLFYLFTADELTDQLRSMGYAFDPERIPANVDYYVARTSHGSTLSRIVHSWVLARSDRARSFRLFEEALRADIADSQGGTTPEGIHLGAMAGTVDLVKRGYTGAVARDGILWLEPRLPDEIGELHTRFRVHGAWLDVRITRASIEVAYTAGHAAVARVGLDGRVRELTRGMRCRVERREAANGGARAPATAQTTA